MMIVKYILDAYEMCSWAMLVTYKCDLKIILIESDLTDVQFLFFLSPLPTPPIVLLSMFWHMTYFAVILYLTILIF